MPRRLDASTWFDPQCGQILCTAVISILPKLPAGPANASLHQSRTRARQAGDFPWRAFNPPTRAHMAMAEAALEMVDEVLFALPRRFPHKEYSGAGFEARVGLLRAALAGHPRFSLAAVDGGLFIDIAREALGAYGVGTEIFLLCGRDAAERIINWDYGSGPDFLKLLEQFQLIVAGRGGHFHAPPTLRHRVQSIAIPGELADISSSELRRRIRSGEPWRLLAPPSTVPLIEANLDLW